MKPKISIIIPVYNVEEYIKRCLESIMNQTFKDFELILVNDGSTDNSGHICNEYMKKYSNIKVIHKSNGGVSSARNIGIYEAKGEYVGFIDPDDYIRKDMYKELYENIVKNKCDIAISSFLTIRDGIKEYHDKANFKNVYTKFEAIDMYFDSVYPFNYSFLVNKLFKRSLFNGIRLNENISYQEDTEVIIKLYNNSKKIIYIDKELYVYDIRNGSLSSDSISIGKLTTIDAFYSIYKYTIVNLPEFKSKAMFKYISYVFNIIIEIIKNYEEYNREYYNVINKIKNIYFIIIKDKFIPIKYKIHATVLIFSPKLYKRYIAIKL